MNTIAFIDTEIDTKSLEIMDIGGVKATGEFFHSSSVRDFIRFLDNTDFVCGHNIFHHDLKYLKNAIHDANRQVFLIDTLPLSPLLFPAKPYHALLKDDKLQTEDINNPLNDSIKAKDLFFDEIAAFRQIDDTLKQIYYLLLHEIPEFNSFFKFVGYQSEQQNTEALIREAFTSDICANAKLKALINDSPVELAYCLSLIHAKSRYSITPPWVIKNYPDVERIIHVLRNTPCLATCSYCGKALNIHKGLQRFFGFKTFRTYGDEPLQEMAAQAAINSKSILAVFPTGGGKSITFQLPALMSGRNAKGLSVVISPLQSLMKDQVDNLENSGITEAVTINGLLDPIERAKSIERVEDGSASILYISPESLRSKTIEHLLLGRNIVRFIIDEAHCFSSWGQDFRVDYLYIGDFIRSIQEKKCLAEPIAVSCFTATAKQNVIEDICNYFQEKLSLELEIFCSKSTRTNLRYKVYPKENEEDKYNTLRDLIKEKNCPTIVYVSRTHRAYTLAERLSSDGFFAKPYHGKMDKKEKSENQDEFIRGDVQIIVATSAFGMGVDKKDVGLVVHFEISDSLENYIQEAGRAGRDEDITADCFVLFNEEDLSKHFILLNQTKLSIKEIQQVWKAIKESTRFRSKISSSALEIARKAGWDDTIVEIETRVTTAIAALEDAGYLKRGQNIPRIFANSILSKNAQEAIDQINASEKFRENQKEQGVRIIKKLFSSKSRKQKTDEAAESRIDYISDHLGIVKEEVINVVNLLREENILADAKDLTAFIKKGENKNHSLNIVQNYAKIENLLLHLFEEEEKMFHIKELNELAEKDGCEDCTPKKIKTIINFWAIKNWIKRKNRDFSKNHMLILCVQPKEILREKLQKRHELAKFIIEYLYAKSISPNINDEKKRGQALIEFSVHELKTAYENKLKLFKSNISIADIEDTLFYLSRIDAIKIEGGFLVVYNRLTIERLEQDNKKRYKKDDYKKLNQFYDNKVQQIHIVGEYAKKMISDYQEALQFVEDYFHLNSASFVNKYFKGSRKNEINRNLTPTKFKQLFGELSASQLKIINDKESKHIVVAAGPGSGKTRILVHKLASLLLMEDVKHEQLLMLTFSRAAATEFKKRLIKLIGNAANYIEIKTFHSYCFDLLGKIGTLEKSDEILKKTVEKIKNGDVELSRITKTVLVIDEAQDMNADEFALISALMQHNEEMRVVAVGDDDQNIYQFRAASSMHLEGLIRNNNATKHELIENYRSRSNLVDFTNQFVKSIQRRLKSVPIVAKTPENGSIKLIKYKCNQLIVPLVNDILTTDLCGTTAVLTKTNAEALQITGLLLKNGMPAKLIHSNDGFPLGNLFEIRFFLDQLQLDDDVYVISDELWKNAKWALWNTYKESSNINICVNLVKDFEASNPKKKYKSDFEVFIQESKLEDFYKEKGETIYVSTIHKAKGKEFDTVFLMLENINTLNDEIKRQLYVAMTRAKQNLIIHTSGTYLDRIATENMIKIQDEQDWQPPTDLIVQLSFKDVWLDYFTTRQYHISQLIAGDPLIIKGKECLDKNGRTVLKFSSQFLQQMESFTRNNFYPEEAKVRFIIYWKKEGAIEEARIILPEIVFEKRLLEK